jgi:hypothetical protein
MTDISSAPGEEETRSQTVSVIVFAGDSAGDRGLSGASHAVQPEDTPFVMSISPCHYLLKDVDSGLGEAKRVMLLVIGIEGCLSSIRKLV